MELIGIDKMELIGIDKMETDPIVSWLLLQSLFCKKHQFSFTGKNYKRLQ